MTKKDQIETRRQYVSLIDQRLVSLHGPIVLMTADEPVYLPEDLWEPARIAGCKRVGANGEVTTPEAESMAIVKNVTPKAKTEPVEGSRDERLSPEEKTVANPDPLPNFGAMTKREMEEYGRGIGVEIDRRHNHSALVKKLESAVRTLRAGE